MGVQRRLRVAARHTRAARAQVIAPLSVVCLLVAFTLGRAALDPGSAEAIPPGAAAVKTTAAQLRNALYAAIANPILSLKRQSEQWIIELAATENLEKVAPVNESNLKEVEKVLLKIYERLPLQADELSGDVLTDDSDHAVFVLVKLDEYATEFGENAASPSEKRIAADLKRALRNVSKEEIERIDESKFAANWFRLNPVGDEELNPGELLREAAGQAGADPPAAGLFEAILGRACSIFAGDVRSSDAQRAASLGGDDCSGLPDPDASLSELEQDASPEVKSELQAVAPDSSEGVNTDFAQMEQEQDQATSQLEATGNEALGEDRAVAKGATLSDVTEPLQEDDAKLQDETQQATLDEGIYDEMPPASGLPAPASLATTQEVSDIGVEETSEIAEEAEEEVSEDVERSVGGVADLAEGLMDPVMLTMLASQGPQIITSVVNMISGTPSFEELVLQQLAAIQKQIHELSKQVEEGFTEVDSSLREVDTTLKQDAVLLEHTSRNVEQLSSNMSELQDKLDQVDADVFRVASTQREEVFQEALNTDLGYSEQTEGAQLPLFQFVQAAGLFYTWGAQDPFNAISELPRSDWSNAPEEIYSQLGSAAADNPLDFNLDYLAAYLSEHEWGSEVDTGLPNPEIWGAGSAAYSQLLVENPTYVTEAQRNELLNLEGVGTELLAPLAELTVPGQAQEVDGGQIQTGSGVLNHALAHYLQTATAAQEPSLLNRVQAQENYALSTQHPGAGDPNCAPCSLGIEPTSEPADVGEALIEPWGSPEQAPAEALAPFQSSTDPAQEGEAGVSKPGYINACRDTLVNYPAYPLEQEVIRLAIPAKVGSPAEKDELLDPLPNVYANAWHLGLGHLIACYETKWSTPPVFDRGALSVAVNWYWYKATQTGEERPALAAKLTLNLPDERVCESHTGEDLQQAWEFTSECEHVGLSTYLSFAARELEKLAVPQNLDEAECDSKILAHTDVPEKYSCSASVSSPASLGITKEVEQTLLGLQGEVYRSIAPPADNETLSATGADVQAAAARLNGARALLDDYIELGLPDSMSSDPELSRLVLGGAECPVTGVEGATSAACHLPDSSPGDYELYNFFRSYAGKTNPAAKGGPLEAMIKQRTGELAAQLQEDIGLSGAEEGEGEADPLITATLDRLELTAQVLAPAPENTKAPEVLGVAAVGDTLTCTEGEWKGDPAPALSYEWLRGSTLVGSGQSYMVSDEDVGQTLSCVVRAESNGAEASAASAGVLVAPDPAFTITVAQEINGSGKGFTTAELSGATGQTVDYEITAKNSGNVPLTFANFTDESCLGIAGGPGLAEVTPGQSTVYTCAVTLTSHGTFFNEAIVEGVPPAGEGFSLIRASNVVIAHGPNPAPRAETGGASEVRQRTALLKGTVNPEGKSVSSCRFEYGASALKSSASCSPPPGSGSSPVAMSAQLKALAPSTSYRYRVSATSVNGTGTGSEGEFKTMPAVAPSVESPSSSEVEQRTAVATSLVNPNGGEVTACKVEYGASSLTMSAPCSKLPGSGTDAVAVSARLAGLAPNTSYRFRVSAGSLSGTTKGPERTFKTMFAFLPTVETGNASEVGLHAAVLNAKVNPNGGEVTSCKFEYGTKSLTQSVSCGKLPGLGTSAVSVSAVLKGLIAATTYHFRISATSLSGTSKGSEGAFET
jgi:hypothetical protein